MTSYTDWPRSGINYDDPLYEKCSPNLLNLKDFLLYVYNREFLGCHNDRTVRAGSTPSTHSWGAALDWGRIAKKITPAIKKEREVLVKEIIPFLIWTSERNLSGIQQIHDYAGDKVWKCNRDVITYPEGWKTQNGAGAGMGDEWAQYIHVEVNKEFHQTPVDYGYLFKSYLGLLRKPIMLGDLKIVTPYRLYDSREVYSEPLQANTLVTVNCPAKAVLINVTPIAFSDSGFISFANRDTSISNWSRRDEVRPNCVPAVANEGRLEFFVKDACHLIIDVFAETPSEG